MFKKELPLQCPVCESANYSKVKIDLPDGEIYGADVFKCAMCSFRFIDRKRNAPHALAAQSTPA